MSNKVDAALKAREERRKKELEELKKKQEEKISSALAARDNRIKSGLQSTLTDLDKRIKAEAEALKSLSAPSWGSESYKSTLESTRQSRINIGKLNSEVEALRKYIGDEDTDKVLSSIGEMSSFYDSYLGVAETYSKFKSEDEYNKALQKHKDYTAKLEFDLDAGQAELDTLKANRKEIESLLAEAKAMVPGEGKTLSPTQSQANLARLEEINNRLKELGGVGEGAVSELDTTIAEKERYLREARRLQEAYALGAVNDPESEFYDPAFDSKSGYVSTVTHKFLGNPRMGDETYEYVNNQIIDDQSWNDYDRNARDIIKGNYTTMSMDNPYSDGESPFEEKGYDYLNEDEIAIYNYYYATGGKDAAQKYLDSIQETLNARKAGVMFENLEGKWALELLFGVEAGLDQFKSGMENLFSQEDYIPPSAYQMASQMVREDLGDSDFKIWGSTVGQIAYDATTTTANMLPSILTSTAIGFVNPGAGAVVGAGLLGASASGNAYAEMLNLGYTKGQARTYAAFVGGSEALLQYALGGIGKLGGKLSGNALTKAVSKIDNAFARVAIKLGGEMASEALEEGFQTVLEPWFKSIATGVDFEAPNIDEVLYSSLLGALSAAGIGGVTTIGGEAIANHRASTKYGGAAQDLINEAREIGTDDALHFANKYQPLLDKGKTLTGAQLNRLIESNQKGIPESDIKKIASAAEARLTALGETGDVATIASALAKRVAGEKLSLTEKAALLNSQYSQRVANELNRDNVESGRYTSDWVQDIGTSAINDDIYNLAEEVAGVNDLEGKFAVRNGELVLKEEFPKVKYNPKTKTASFPTQEASAIAKAEGEDENTSTKRIAADGVYDTSDNGKTIYMDEEVSIKGIASVKDGKLAIRLDNGETADAKDVSFGSHDEAMFFEMLARTGASAETANELYAGFNARNDTPALMYIADLPLAYQYGLMGFEKGLDNLQIPDAQKRIAYNRGRIDAMSDANDRSKAPAVLKAPSTKSKKNGIIYEGFEYDAKTATDIQRASIKGIETLAKLSPTLEFHVYRSELKNGKRVAYIDGELIEAAPNGYFTAGNKIYLDLNAGKGGEGVMLYTVSHEIGHYIRLWNAKGFKVIGDFLLEQYGKNGVPVDALIQRQKTKIKNRLKREGKAIPSEAKLNDMAYEEMVCDAMSTMFADPKAYEKLAELKMKNPNVFKKLGEAIKKVLEKLKSLLGIYKEQTPDAPEAGYVMKFAPEVYEKLQDLYLKAFAEAEARHEASLLTMDETTDPVAVEDVTQYSYRSLAEAAGFEAVENEDGSRSFIRDGAAVSEVTVEDIENSPIGAFINFSLEQGDIDEVNADRQKKMFADICTMACKTNDFSMTMQFVGSAVFTGMKANADKQYGTTYDFPSICTKTQAVIDAMSARMKKLGRGLNGDEIVELYREVFASGNPVPCPECYVFSRWIGIGGLLDNIKKYQDYYGEMPVSEVAKAYKKMRSEVEAFAKEQGLTFGKAKGALTSKLTKEFNKLTDKIEKATNQGEAVKEADRKRLAELEPMMNTVKSMTWLENVYFADSSLTKVNKNFRVPNEVLFDLNNGEAFATEYPEAWAFRTTQGAGYGKAITPYAEASLGEGVLVTNNTTNAIKGKAKGTLDNYFLQQRGKLDAKSRKALLNARAKQKNQAFIGGQRFQSTSDARYENASDYLLAALEMQAMRGMVQVYTKVDGAVPAFANWGFSINQSLMPLGGGLDADGNVKDTSVGGMNPKVAFENRKKYDSAGTITIGVNDNHIRKLFQQQNRDFVIPYHASGGKADIVAEFRMIQDRAAKRDAKVRSTDYSRTQSDKILSDEVLKWLGKTDAEIERIHKVREARIAILTRGKVDMDVVRSNGFLSSLYDKLHGGEWDGVKLAKSKVESQIYPNEFWDQTVSYDDSGKITSDYLQYCEDLGFLHRFSGLIPSNGKLIPVYGYDQNGNRVQLTDLAYKYDENGQKTDAVEDFFWSVITDRRMYDNNGAYLPQKYVTLNDTTTDTVTTFAKNNDGRQYNKQVSLETASKLADAQFSDRDSAESATQFVSHMENVLKNRGDWYASDVVDYVAEHPELNFVARIYAKDKDVKKDLEAFLSGIDDVGILEGLSWYIGEAYSDIAPRWNGNGKIVYPYGGSVRTFRNAIKKRENAIMAEKVGGTNLGIKNGEVTLDDIENLFYRLNSNAEVGEFAKKVFATARMLGVNVRFTNQLIKKAPKGKLIAGEAFGDMVQYKTSYFNDAARTDQSKAKTILHELLHTCTSYVMRENVSAGDVRWAGRSDNYNRIANAATRLNRIYGQIVGDPDFKGQYGITNPREMVAELANEKFVDLLKKKSLWEQIVDWICELFGFRRGTSAYDNARMCVDYILDNPEVSEYKRHALEQRDAVRMAGYEAFGSTIDSDGDVHYSDRDSDSISTRSLLANALEGAAQNDIERQKLTQYKQKISLIEAEQAKLSEIRLKIRELSFAKGPKDTAQIKSLQFEEKQAANRINTYDRQLLNLQATTALKNVLEREKKMAYDKAKKEGKEALANYREKVAKTQRELITRWQDSRKQAVEGRNKTEMRHKIRSIVSDLNKLLLNPTKEKHIPIGLQKPVAEALEIINMDTIGAEERVAKYNALIAKAKDPDKIKQLTATRDRIEMQGENLAEKMSALKTAYDEIVDSDDPLIANSHDDVISERMKLVIQRVGNTPIRDMSLVQLEDVYDMYKMVLTTVRNANKAFKAAKGESISILAGRVMEEVEKVGGKKAYRLKGTDGLDKFNWNNQKPIYAFERIGSTTLTDLYGSMRSGEDTWATDVSEARAYYLERYKKFHYDSWDFKQRFGFTSTSGMNFELSLDQIMSLYAYSKRAQAKDHLKKGGIVIDETTEVTVKSKLGIPLKFNPTQATAYNLSDETLASIIDKLTPEQKAFVDEMQDYLSTVMGDKGNEVSLELYGIKLFKDKNYFPLKSATQFMAKAKEQQQGEVKVKNKGMTQSTVPKASNPIVLTPFMDVWADHVNEMSMYHAFVLPMEDFYRVYNYRTPTSETMATESVEMFIQNAYGKGATQYIDQLLKDLNGGARTDPRETVGKALVSKFKKAAVMASLSVVVQQPTAMVRAMALVDVKHFGVAPISRGILRTFNAKKHKAMWAEVKKYAPVAIIKEMGYFDTNMGRSTKDFLMAKEYSGIGEKAKALVADGSYRDEALSRLPALADELAWISIWEAVKRETISKNKSLAPNSEEFLKKVGERFTEVVTKTQVYDSVLSRSGLMRSKSGLVNMWTSFMGEPTTSLNMLQDALLKGKRGNKKYAAKVIGAVYGSVILNSVLVSLVYAMRDDDEDETYLEKYLARLSTEILDGINPLTYIPIVKDVWSIAQGFDIERADMSLLTDLIDSIQKTVTVMAKDTEDMDEDELAEHQKQVADALWSIGDNISSLVGIPVKNIRREIEGFINLGKTIATDSERDTSFGSLMDEIWEDVKDSIPVVGWLPDEGKTDKLYDAIVGGDAAYRKRIEESYGTKSALDNALRKALRENDPRIKEAAEARNNGDIAEYMRIAKSIIAEGHFSQDNVVAAINAEINAMNKGESTTTTKDEESSIFKMDDYYAAIVGRDQATAAAVKEDIIRTDVKNGKDREEAEENFVSRFVSHCREKYDEGHLSDREAENMLVKYAGKSEKDAANKVQYWEFKQEYPDYDLSEEVVTKYYSDVEPSGISIKVYYDYSTQRSKCKGTDSNGDGKTDSGSVKREVLRVIHSMPISNSQKDVLYFLNGWSASTIHEAPWR
jgi:hypothetical protein